METEDLMKRRYERVQSYGSNEDDGNLGPCNGRMARTERIGPLFVCNWITIKMDEMTRAVSVDVLRSSTASFVSRLVKIIEVSA